MLARVIRCGSESEATPGPAYSKIFPAPPRTLSRRRSSMITSFAVTHGWSSPVSHTLTTSGIVKEYGPPPSATATSRPPAPIASMPAAPQSGVWLSVPSSVCPGTEKLSRCTWWQMPLPGLEKRSEEHTSELQSRLHLVCRLLLEKKKKIVKLVRLGRNPSHIH